MGAQADNLAAARQYIKAIECGACGEEIAPFFATEAIEAALEDLLAAGRTSSLQRWVAAARASGAEGGLIDYAESEARLRSDELDAALALASQAAKFATPGVNIGLFCSTPMVALSRNVSRKHAMQMLLTGDLISADEAARIGLVNQVVPAGHERAAALELAEKIAAKSTLTVQTGKEAFYRQAEMTLAEAYAYASKVMVENMLARDAEEGISAFIEKREAKWQDR